MSIPRWHISFANRVYGQVATCSCITFTNRACKPHVETRHCLVSTAAYLVCKLRVGTSRDLSLRYGGKPYVKTRQCLVSTAMAYLVCKSRVGIGRDLSVRNSGNRGGGQVATCPYAYGGKSRLQTTRRDKALPCPYRNGISRLQIACRDRSGPVRA